MMGRCSRSLAVNEKRGARERGLVPDIVPTRFHFLTGTSCALTCFETSGTVRDATTVSSDARLLRQTPTQVIVTYKMRSTQHAFTSTTTHPVVTKDEIMTSKIKPPTRQNLANELTQRLEMHGLKRGNPKLAHDDHDSYWCKLATWTKSGGNFDIYAYFGDYLGNGEMLWIGFGSPNSEIIEQVQKEFGTQEITQFSISEWETMWDAASDLHKALASPNNVALEDYREDGNYIWIGRYLLKDADVLARSQKFILDVLRELDPVVFAEEDEIAWTGPVDREATVKVRLAQNTFRKKLEVRWGGRCAVTGSMLKATLRASHIVSWADGSVAEKTHPDNGLLLTASLDALFDRGYISFRGTGEIIIGSTLSDDERKMHGLHEGLHLRIAPNEKQMIYLRRHRSKHVKRLGSVA